MKFSFEQTLEILSQTPKTITSLLEHTSEKWLFANEGSDSWSCFDIVGHLIHGEKTDWIPRLKIILFNENKHFLAFDRFAQFKTSKGKTIHDLLIEFKKLRVINMQCLKSLDLTKKQLKLIGVHPEFGEVTAKQLLATWAVHDLSHIAQISRVLAKQYKNEVGPWKAYIPILDR